MSFLFQGLDDTLSITGRLLGTESGWEIWDMNVEDPETFVWENR